jgi:hypothetical protein
MVKGILKKQNNLTAFYCGIFLLHRVVNLIVAAKLLAELCKRLTTLRLSDILEYAGFFTIYN